ncbi:VWA domain-containing protein [Nocardia noduli]|uniref:VWA domain-containing protein n=1 Tax=Nocardia noduli TaxID=2815722 RepID=UPI001C2358D0|nr:VWA domain-containing protein [Nocardia noduli]
MTELGPELERWRLILGEPAQSLAQSTMLSAQAAAQDAALEWLYGRDPELAARGVRSGGPGGNEPSRLTPVDWLDNIHRLFPKATIERLERDAIQRFDLTEIVTDPDVLQRLEPNTTLLSALLRTKHLMDPQVLRHARRIVEAVVRQLIEKLATEILTSFSGTRTRRSSRSARAADFDFRATITDNLAHYRPDERRLYVETAHFRARARRRLERRQVILLVDQSGSMVRSVIHSAVTAACLWGLPGIKTHLVAFDTSVVDLTKDVDDPVELLMSVQLGGGTDIAQALNYGARLIENPRKAIVVLITDFGEGQDPHRLIRAAAQLTRQGTTVLGLAALDESADPWYDRAIAQRMADVGVQVGAMTPGELVGFLADTIGK